MHNLLYQMRQTAAARIAAILKARPKEVMPSALNDTPIPGLPVNGAAPTAPEDERAEFEQWEREAWGV